MDAFWFAIAFLHLLAAVVWVGGTLLLAVVGPAVRRSGSPGAREMLRIAGRRFLLTSWVAVGVLLATGVLFLGRDGVLADPGGALAARPALTIKVLVVAAMVAVKVMHDFVVGPRASRQAAARDGPPSAIPMWRAAMALGMANASLGVVLLGLGTIVAHGG